MLNEPGVPVLVPDVVLGEISALGPDDPVVLAVQQAGWMQIAATPPIPPSVASWKLDDGEAAVITLALQSPDSMVVLDDLAARRCAQSLGLPTQGTLGLVLVAKQLGLIRAVLPVLEALEQAGMFMRPQLKTQILTAAGE